MRVRVRVGVRVRVRVDRPSPRARPSPSASLVRVQAHAVRERREDLERLARDAHALLDLARLRGRVEIRGRARVSTRCST